MNIEINKDFRRSYKDDFWRGFSLREMICVVAGLAVWSLVAVVARLVFSLQMNASILLGFPLSAPVFVFGFFRPQNRLTILQWIRENVYLARTKTAVFSSLEEPEGVEAGRGYKMETGAEKKEKRLPYKRQKQGGRNKK